MASQFKPPVDPPIYVVANGETGLGFYLGEDDRIRWNDGGDWSRLSDQFHRYLWEFAINNLNLALALMGVEHSGQYDRWEEVREYVLRGGDLCNSAS